jgi:hypothetical protein
MDKNEQQAHEKSKQDPVILPVADQPADHGAASDSVDTLFSFFSAPIQPSKKKPAPQPVFEVHDLDGIQIHRGLELALRTLNITHPFAEAKTGLLAQGATLRLAYKDPIQIVKTGGYLRCFGGANTLEEARKSIPFPRYFPVLVYPSVTQDDIIMEVIFDEIVKQIRARFDSEKMPDFVASTLEIAHQFSSIFPDHNKDEWAALLRRAARTFRKKGKKTS